MRKKAKVGNFVEMKKTELGEGSKANHLSYLGDARVGKASTSAPGRSPAIMTVWKKYQTVIGDNVFLGSDTQLMRR